MYFVYSLQSELNPTKYYIGVTTNVEERLKDHNSGKATHTSQYRPWKLVTYTAFPEKPKAKEFEKYLKSASGRAFAKKRF